MTTTDSAPPPDSPNDAGGANGSEPSEHSVGLVSPLLEFSAEQALAEYLRQDYSALSRRLLTVLDYLHDTTFRGLDARSAHAVAQFAKHFFFLFTQPDWRLSEAEALAYIARNPVIANLARLSEYGTTDPWLRVVLGQPANLAKLLALYSPRNRVPLQPEKFFAASSRLASRWYFASLGNFRADCSDPETLDRLRRQLLFEDHRLTIEPPEVLHAYFGATYIDDRIDHVVKRRINRLFQANRVCQRPIVNRPNPRRIAVLTAMWWPGQSVYRSQQPFLAALAEKYELVLIQLGQSRREPDRGCFREVRHLTLADGARTFDSIDPNDFAMAYFPDVGMSRESIVLSNMRIAPIQVANYGHPSSTHGGLIDYWIGGREVESIAAARDNYSERLVLIPGCAQAPLPVDYRPTFPTLDDATIQVSCSWYAQKINVDHLRRLAAIARRARRPVNFRFLPGSSIAMNNFIPLKQHLEAALGPDRFTLFSALEYAPYMTALESAHFALDAHPFGGYNTAVDLLSLRQPIVTLEGDRFYGRSTAYLLRRAGLDHLIATTDEQFIDLAVRMIDDASFRAEQTARLRTLDLASTVLSLEHVPAFVRAVDHLIANHDSLSRDVDRAPILID